MAKLATLCLLVALLATSVAAKQKECKANDDCPEGYECPGYLIFNLFRSVYCEKKDAAKRSAELVSENVKRHERAVDSKSSFDEKEVTAIATDTDVTGTPEFVKVSGVATEVTFVATAETVAASATNAASGEATTAHPQAENPTTAKQ